MVTEDRLIQVKNQIYQRMRKMEENAEVIMNWKREDMGKIDKLKKRVEKLESADKTDSKNGGKGK